jgi:protein TonB
MGELKRFILPAFAALLIHSILVSIDLPSQQTIPSGRLENSIQVTIDNVSPGKIDKPKKEAGQQPQMVHEPVLEPRVESDPVTVAEPVKQRKKPLEQKSSVAPVVTAEKRKRIVEEQPITKVVGERDEGGHEKPANQEPVDVTVAQVERSAEHNTVEAERAAFAADAKAKPMYLQNRQPPYPGIARKRRYTGEVVLLVLVDAGGMVTEISLKHSSGHASLDRAALEAVRDWRFVPATKNGYPVSMWVDVPVRFKLE